MNEKKNKKQKKTESERIARIKDTILSMDYVCSGTLLKRMKVCGKPGCRCAKDPKARHGPYHEWGRMKDGKLVHKVISPEEARYLRRAIANYRTILRLLRSWENETVRILKVGKRRKK